MSSKLRKASWIELVGFDSEELSCSSQLPTTRDVLCVFSCHMKMCHDVRQGAREAVRRVAEIWNTTKVPRVQDIRAIEKVERVYNDWRALFKNEKPSTNEEELSEQASTSDVLTPKQTFESKLDKLFDISKKSSLDELQAMIRASKTDSEREAWEEEKLFFLDQLGPRLMKIGGIDVKMRRADRKRAETEKRSVQRLLESEKRKQKELERRKCSG